MRTLQAGAIVCALFAIAYVGNDLQWVWMVMSAVGLVLDAYSGRHR